MRGVMKRRTAFAVVALAIGLLAGGSAHAANYTCKGVGPAVVCYKTTGGVGLAGAAPEAAFWLEAGKGHVIALTEVANSVNGALLGCDISTHRYEILYFINSGEPSQLKTKLSCSG